MARILLVEDSEQIWNFLARRLQRRGHTVILAHDGEQGVANAKSGQPNIILLDMNLPVMDGWSAARALKADPVTGTIPIIAMTEHVASGAAEKILQAGCDDFHPKPVDLARLLHQIDTLCPPIPVDTTAAVAG